MSRVGEREKESKYKNGRERAIFSSSLVSFFFAFFLRENQKTLVLLFFSAQYSKLVLVLPDRSECLRVARLRRHAELPSGSEGSNGLRNGIGALLLPKQRGHRRKPCLPVGVDLCGPLPQLCVCRVETRGPPRVGLRVLVRAEDARVVGQREQLGQGLPHLRARRPRRGGRSRGQRACLPEDF